MAVLFSKGQSIVQAKEQETERKAALRIRELASRGNLVYREGGEEAAIYAADLTILEGKLSTVSGTVYDPAEYTHMHQWEYRDMDGSTHTRHCVLCGLELIDAHKAENENDCRISYGGAEFSGRRFQCACGYQWEMETAHTLTFDMVDETCHRGRCLLDGTAYCPGCEFAEEEHYAFYHTMDPSGTHYTKTCIDCGYQTEEEIMQSRDLEQPEEEEQPPDLEQSEEEEQTPDLEQPEEEEQPPDLEQPEEEEQPPEFSESSGRETTENEVGGRPRQS